MQTNPVWRMVRALIAAYILSGILLMVLSFALFKFQHFKEQHEEGRLRRMPDILPVCVQNILHSRKPEL